MTAAKKTAREIADGIINDARILHGIGHDAVVVEVITAALEQARADGRAEGLEEAAKLVEGGHFLHDAAPDALFGRACAAAIRILAARGAKG